MSDDRTERQAIAAAYRAVQNAPANWSDEVVWGNAEAAWRAHSPIWRAALRLTAKLAQAAAEIVRLRAALAEIATGRNAEGRVSAAPRAVAADALAAPDTKRKARRRALEELVRMGQEDGEYGR